MSEHVLAQIDAVLAETPPRLRPSGFETEVDRDNGARVVRLRGELDMASAPRLRRALDTALDSRPSCLAVDLADLTFVDSSGIRVLLAAGSRAQDEGTSFVLRSPSRSVLKALRLTSADRLLPPSPLPAS